MANLLDEFERFKWDVLGDLVWEDYEGLWEPLWWLRGGGQIEGQTETERRSYAERALRELHGAGLIYFFRVRGGDVNASGSDPACTLPASAVDEALSADWWRTEGGLPKDHPMIWIGSTPAGEAAAKTPPSEVIDYWRTANHWPPGWLPDGMRTH